MTQQTQCVVCVPKESVPLRYMEGRSSKTRYYIAEIVIQFPVFLRNTISVWTTITCVDKAKLKSSRNFPLEFWILCGIVVWSLRLFLKRYSYPRYHCFWLSRCIWKVGDRARISQKVQLHGRARLQHMLEMQVRQRRTGSYLVIQHLFTFVFEKRVVGKADTCTTLFYGIRFYV